MLLPLSNLPSRYQREFSGGFRPDDGSPDDIIYVPRHPAW